MPKGFFTQSAYVLLDRAVAIEAVANALIAFSIDRRREAPADSRPWMGNGTQLILGFRPEVNGYAVVDVVDQPWPDGMGDPKKEFSIFGAWAMGHFGPFVFPGNLERARQQLFGWDDGKVLALSHTGFVRIRTSYVLGANKDSPVMPKDYDSEAEIVFVTELAIALLGLEGAIAYFNPNGEVLANRATLAELLERHRGSGPPAVEAWSNVRIVNLGEHAPGWMMMDTVGMAQLEVADQEAVFPEKAYDLNEVANFLRNATAYVLANGPVIKNGDTMDGPGDVRWQGVTFEDSLAPPPRRALRWLPLNDRSKAPPALLVAPPRPK